MTHDEKLIHYATAKKVTAKEITQYIDGDFVTMWAGRVRGVFVKSVDEFKFDTKEQALSFARRWRDSAIVEAKEKGLIHGKGR